VDVNTKAYDTGHLPGAVGWNWQTQLQDRLQRDVVGREDFERLLGQAGITPETTVVLYGDNNNWFAAYAYWLLTYYGHDAVYLIDGGRKKWEAEGRPLTTDVPSYAATSYRFTQPNDHLRAFRRDVERHLEQPDAALVDVRSPDEFTGTILAPPGLNETCQRGGHIPGASNIPWSKAVQDDGTFKPEAALRALYEGAGVAPENDVITYCRIGERSAHSWFVLQLRRLLDGVGQPDRRAHRTVMERMASSRWPVGFVIAIFSLLLTSYIPFSMNIALVGTGQMGQAVAALAAERGHAVVARFDSTHPLTEAGASALHGADVVIDFSLPDLALPHVERYCRWNRAAVVGTTGWYDALDQVREWVAGSEAAILYAPNFSLGVALLVRALRGVVPLLERLPEYDAAIHEAHHTRKVDSPSGTALLLADVLLDGLSRKTHAAIETQHQRIDPAALHVTSARLGSVVGEHTVRLDSPFDALEFVHRAKSRQGFAFGAVKAAEWLPGRRGLFTLDDLLADWLPG